MGSSLSAAPLSCTAKRQSVAGQSGCQIIFSRNDCWQPPVGDMGRWLAGREGSRAVGPPRAAGRTFAALPTGAALASAHPTLQIPSYQILQKGLRAPAAQDSPLCSRRASKHGRPGLEPHSYLIQAGRDGRSAGSWSEGARHCPPDVLGASIGGLQCSHEIVLPAQAYC
jgi:hypothetical protein